MKISDELKQRIKQLELEQERQQRELVDLEQLRDLAAIEEMEKELATIDANFAPLVDVTPKTQDIDLLKESDLLKEGDVPVATTTVQAPQDIDLTLEELTRPKSKVQGKGFVILLMFDPKSPTEWSEESSGWRGKGQGTVYSTENDAKIVLKKLKQKWPDYPLKIITN